MAAFIRASACLRSEMSRMMLDKYPLNGPGVSWTMTTWDTGISRPSFPRTMFSPSQTPAADAAGSPSVSIFLMACSGKRSETRLPSKGALSWPRSLRPAWLRNVSLPSGRAVQTKSLVDSSMVTRNSRSALAADSRRMSMLWRIMSARRMAARIRASAMKALTQPMNRSSRSRCLCRISWAVAWDSSRRADALRKVSRSRECTMRMVRGESGGRPETPMASHCRTSTRDGATAE